MRNSEKIILGIIIVSLAAAFYLYPRMPEQMALHWNWLGEVDGYGSKFWGLFLMPIVSFVLFFFLTLLPKIDPLQENIEKFRKYFDGFIVTLFLFLFYVFLLSVFWNFGARFNLGQFIIPAWVILLYCLGMLLEKTKKNWFVGIRTPWTLSSETVWEKTHLLGGKLFKIAAIFSLSGLFFPSVSIFLVFTPNILAAVFLIFYSYFEYRKERHPQ